MLTAHFGFTVLRLLARLKAGAFAVTSVHGLRRFRAGFVRDLGAARLARLGLRAAFTATTATAATTSATATTAATFAFGSCPRQRQRRSPHAKSVACVSPSAALASSGCVDIPACGALCVLAAS